MFFIEEWIFYMMVIVVVTIDDLCYSLFGVAREAFEHHLLLTNRRLSTTKLSCYRYRCLT